MPNDPLYSKMKVEHDIQIAIDQNDASEFVKLIKSTQRVSFICSPLPPRQPHSCDNPEEIWGHPTCIFTKLNIETNPTNKEYGIVENLGEAITLSLSSFQVKNLATTIKSAISTPVFFEYEHYLLLTDEIGELIKLNVWGWCQNRQIEYAN